MKDIRNIILDIDNTLLHAVPHEHVCEEWKREFTVVHNTHFLWFLRPGLQAFLRFVFDNFRVGIWTAGVEEYAYDVVEDVIMPLLRKDQQDNLEFIFHRYHYEQCLQLYGTYKDLKYVQGRVPRFKREHTCIIDDLEYVFETNQEHCVPCFPFQVYMDRSKERQFASMVTSNAHSSNAPENAYRFPKNILKSWSDPRATHDKFLLDVQDYLLECKRPVSDLEAAIEHLCEWITEDRTSPFDWYDTPVSDDDSFEEDRVFGDC